MFRLIPVDHFVWTLVCPVTLQAQLVLTAVVEHERNCVIPEDLAGKLATVKALD